MSTIRRLTALVASCLAIGIAVVNVNKAFAVESGAGRSSAKSADPGSLEPSVTSPAPLGAWDGRDAEVCGAELEGVDAVPPSGAADLVASGDSESRRKCPPGIEKCKASQAGQPCHPPDLNIVCSPQANGGFCCLAIAH